MLLEEFDMEEVKACWQKEAAEKAAKEAAKEATAKATKEATSRTLDRDRKLFNLLLTQKRYDEATRATTDEEYQMKLFEMYGI